MSESILHQRHIVVTRPREQADRLAARLRSEGAIPVVFPAIEIRPLVVAPVPLADYDLAIFISANAVLHGLPAVAITPRATGSIIVAIGSATAAALAAANVANVRAPIEHFDSEGVLAMPELQAITGKRVLIVRGVGGRDALAKTMRARGALVDYLECYERRIPEADPAPLLALWQSGRIDAVSFTSTEGIGNFRSLIGAPGHAFLADTPAFVPHPRIGAYARGAGLRKVLEIAPGDDGLIAGMQRFFATVAAVPATHDDLRGHGPSAAR
jgi:uroporphyrinogen-III synthase